MRFGHERVGLLRGFPVRSLSKVLLLSPLFAFAIGVSADNYVNVLLDTDKFYYELMFADEFQKTFRSFAVESQLKRARDLTERYEVHSVPLLIVDGKSVSERLNDALATVGELPETG